MNPIVFISYRRSDDRHAVGRLRDELIDVLGQGSVFMDETEIRAARDYRAEIEAALSASDICVVVIGDRFDTAQLADPDDDVRREIELAQAQRKRILPVFVNATGTPPPADLPPSIAGLIFHQGLPLRPGRDFDRDLADIVAAVNASAPATLAIEFAKPGFMFGDLTIALDGSVVSQSKMRRGASVAATRVQVGPHEIVTTYSAGGIGRTQTIPIDVPAGASVARLTYDRARATVGVSLTRGA